MGVNLLNTFVESIEVEDSRHKKQFIQNYIPWAWDVTEGKFGNKLAYLSTMCRDKTQIAEGHYLSKSIGNNIHKELIGSVLMLDRVKFSPVPLSKTPPFSQVSAVCFEGGIDPMF